MAIDYVNNSATNTTSTVYSSYCPYRLPCGYCEKLGRDCPKQWYDSNLGTVYTNAVDHADLGVIKQ